MVSATTKSNGSVEDKTESKASSNEGDTKPTKLSSNMTSNSSISTPLLLVTLIVAGLSIYVNYYQSTYLTDIDAQTPFQEKIQITRDAMLGDYHQYFGDLLDAHSSQVGNITGFREAWNDIQASIRTASSESSLKSAAAVGHRMATENGSKAKHPVFMVPGFVCSGLELWEGHDCAVKYFRRKIWGSLETFRSFAQDTECWKHHLSLDPETGLDPQGIRLRPSQGFESADFWTSAFWVWDKIIRNLAAVGYDGTNMDMVSYDWRVAFPLLEKRDGHFSKLKARIESFVEYTGEKAVIMGHSMGAPKTFFFLVWVCKPKEEGGGGGGEDWVEKYIHAYVDLGGPLLGIPKAASAILSGEMKDTNVLHPIAPLIEGLFGRVRRHELFSSWGTLWGMTPKGGDDFWGISADVDCGAGKVLRGHKCVSEETAGEPVNTPFLHFTDSANQEYDNPIHTKYASKSTWSFADVMEYLKDWKQGHYGPDLLQGIGSWNDPTQHGLPNAPSLNVYCMYGVGLPTERIFHYWQQEYVEGDVPFLMNETAKDNPSEGLLWNGVRACNGDGTVPLLSLGYMCASGWKPTDPEGPIINSLNPGNARIVTREYQHKGAFQVDDPLRQGPESSEHCDVLGNYEVLEDLIKIVTGENVEPRIVSNIEEIAGQVRANIARSMKREALEGDGE